MMFSLPHVIVLFTCFDGIFTQAEPFIFGCPENILHVIPYGEPGVPVTWTPPRSTDPTVQPSSSHDPRDWFGLGKTRVSYVFVKNGVSAECKFTVEVQQLDTTPPSVTGCPMRVSGIIGYSETLVSVNWTEPTAFDNTGTNVRMRSTHQPGDSFSLGFTPVVYTFTDESENEQSCTFSVSVYIDDMDEPVISGCPPDIVRAVDSHEVFLPVTWTEPTATDESPSGIVELTRRSHSPGDSFRAGVTNVLYVFSDESQNKAVCTFQIHLETQESPRVDHCPRSVIADSRDPDPTISDPQFISTDAFAQDFTMTDNKTYTRTDRNTFNTVICSFEIYRYTVDGEPPPLTSCTLPIMTHAASLGMPGAHVPFSTANVDETSISHPSGSFFSVGQTVVSYLLGDGAGNTRVCSFILIIFPTTSGCPRTTIYGHAKTDGTELQAYWPSPEVMGAELDPPSIESGSLLPLGSTEVSYSSTGDAEEIVCTFKFHVEQTNPLSIRSCPSDMNVTLSDDSSTVKVTWGEPEPINDFDTVPVLEIEQSHDSGFAFPVGNTTVSYQYVDSRQAKFTANCTFVVSVTDITDPVLSGCENRFELSAFLWHGSFPWDSVIQVYDNSDDVTVTSQPDSNYLYPLDEETNFTLTAVDSSGNEVTCESVVVFSLFLPLPALIVILAVIILIVMILLICCCRCCCCRKNKSSEDDDDSPLQQSSRPTSKGIVPAENPSAFSSEGPLSQKNKYETSLRPEPSAPSATNDNSYTYIEGDKVQYINDSTLPVSPVRNPAARKTSTGSPPPVPVSPRPNSGGTLQGHNAGGKGRASTGGADGGDGYVRPDQTDGYLLPGQRIDAEYLYPDIKPQDYSYAYDHTLKGVGFNETKGQ